MQADTLTGGFANAPIDAAHAFRGAMNAMARPGLICALDGAAPPAPLSVAAGTLILTLCDPETPLCLFGEFDVPALHDWITFHTGAPMAARGEAMFALGRWEDMIPLSDFPSGTPEYPDRSATLIVETKTLSPDGAVLRGPGIKASAMLSLPEIAPFQQNAAAFPLGCDFFFTCGVRLAALPRSTQVG